MLVPKKSKQYKRCMIVMVIGMLAMPASLTQASEKSGNQEVLDQIGEQFRHELETIDTVSFGLPEHVSEPSGMLKLSDEAKLDIRSLANENTPVHEVLGHQPAVLSSNVEYLGLEVLDDKLDETVVKYRYVITRETEDLKGDDAWQEAPEFTLKIDPKNQIIKDIDWISDEEADTISEQSQSYVTDEDIVSDDVNPYTWDQLVSDVNEDIMPASLT